MLLDRYERQINYLRISLTNNCNLNCFYCTRPEKPAQEVFRLSFEEILKIIREASLMGFSKIRFTGGEPLLVENIEYLMEKTAKIPGIQEICLTTNGTLLAGKTKILKQVGLSRINISLDTLDRDKHRFITGVDCIDSVLAGINESIAHGLKTKINMVVLKGINEEEIPQMRTFCDKIGAELQLIEQFSIDSEKKQFCRYDRPPNCENCNRIRLLSNGILKPCLHSDLEYKLDFANIKKSFETAVSNKPRKGLRNFTTTMAEIGG